MAVFCNMMKATASFYQDHKLKPGEIHDQYSFADNTQEDTCRDADKMNTYVS